MQLADAATRAASCSAPSDPEDLPSELANTGCMDPDHPTQFAHDVLPYEVNSPLWSDGADKQRGMHLPKAGKIQVRDCARTPDACRGAADSGKWIFPAGTVLLKSFSFDGKLVETRLFAQMTSGTWIGYTYQWNEAQTSATLVPDDRVDVAFNTGERSVNWTYPNRFDCMECHNDKGGSSLGPETAQLNRMVAGQNQIDALAARGVFEDAPAKPYAAALVTPYKDQAGEPPASATLETRIRSYMHANCAFCHRPDSNFPSLDMRFDIAFKDTHLCGSTPLKGDVGVANAKNLAPGQPMQSTAWLRMAAKPNKGRMPQIGTVVVDELGLKLMGDWISSLSACP
ncbi:MAG TPA: hypothetical protein VFN67_39705 [Polyangiales bacterium]|nr:hypothetical protein [Polyangiales bacterium]